MIDSPHSHAPRRANSRRALAAAVRTLVVALLAGGLTLGPATAAHARGGGVSITSTTTTTKKKTKAKGASSRRSRPKSVNKSRLKRAQTLLRLSASGTHDSDTRKVVKRFQQLRGLDATGVVDNETYVQIKNAFALLETGGSSVADAATAEGGGGLTTSDDADPEFVVPDNVAPITSQERDLLDKIAQCESKGNPKIVSANGLYRGKYQFDRSTWKTVGGTGDPAAASEEEQDQRAAILLRQRGTSPWPVCGL